MAVATSQTDIGRQVLNHGYKTRKALLHEHSDNLIETVKSRIAVSNAPRNVHFVTHSFGGVVLKSAFARGLADVIPRETRAVLLAPPLRGAVIGRTFEEETLGERVLPQSARRVLRAAARFYVGNAAGLQLLTKPPEWFEQQTGKFPPNVDVLVIEGKLPVINPVIGDVSDGIVACRETMISTPHRRCSISIPHNFMLFSPTVMRLVRNFIDGKPVGDPHPGAPLVDGD